MSTPTIPTIDVKRLYELSERGPIDLIDVRTLEEFREIRAVGTRNVPLDALNPHAVAKARTAPGDGPLYFICAVGIRSEWACRMMIAAGYSNVVNVEGGTQAWVTAGLPSQQGG